MPAWPSMSYNWNYNMYLLPAWHCRALWVIQWRKLLFQLIHVQIYMTSWWTDHVFEAFMWCHLTTYNHELLAWECAALVYNLYVQQFYTHRVIHMMAAFFWKIIIKLSSVNQVNEILMRVCIYKIVILSQYGIFKKHYMLAWIRITYFFKYKLI